MKSLTEIKELINNKNTLLITTNDMKKQLLSNLTGEFIHQKIITKEEFYDSLFVDKIYTKILIKTKLLKLLNLNYNYDLVERIYKLLAFAYFNKKDDQMSKFVEENNIIEIPRIYKIYKVYTLSIENQYNTLIPESIKINLSIENKKHIIYQFENQIEEIGYVAQEITKQIENGVNPSDIHLITSYETNQINLIFNMYGLFYNIDSSYNIKRDKEIDELINKIELNMYDSIQQIYEDYKENEQIVNVLNNYVLHEDIDLIKGDLNKLTKKTVIKANKITSIDVELVSEYKKIFILGYNKNKIVEAQKESLSITKKQIVDYKLDDNEILTNDKIRRFINLVNQSKALITTNKSNDIETILEDVEIQTKTVRYNSHIFNTLLYKKNYSVFKKYNIITNQMSNLANFKVDYIKKSQFKLTKSPLKDNKFTLSASNIINYLKCPFSFYISDILKIREKQSNSALVGSFIHKILELYYLGNYDTNKIISEVIEEDMYKSIKIYESQFIKYIGELVEVIDNQHFNSNFQITELEKEINYEIDEKFNFIGIADKIIEYNGSQAIIDYKTGNDELKFKKIFTNLEIQNFIYILMLKKQNIDAQYVATFRQKIKPKLTKNTSTKIKNYQLNGLLYGEDNASNLVKDIEENNYINSLKLKKDGIYSGSAFISQVDFENILIKVDELINNVIDEINMNNFEITDKKNKNDSTSLSCKYCKFNDICLKNYYNKVTIEEHSE